MTQCYAPGYKIANYECLVRKPPIRRSPLGRRIETYNTARPDPGENYDNVPQPRGHRL